jgi:hypothetical protein
MPDFTFEPLPRRFVLGMTDDEREAHRPGTGVKTGGVGFLTTAHLNLTRTLAEDPYFAPRLPPGAPYAGKGR